MKTETRYDELKRMLISRQRELLAELQGKIRSVRAEGSEHDRGAQARRARSVLGFEMRG